MNVAEKVLDRLHLRRHSAEKEVEVEDPDVKVKIKERVDPAAERDTAPERDVHPNTPPATGPKVIAPLRKRCRAPHAQLQAKLSKQTSCMYQQESHRTFSR